MEVDWLARVAAPLMILVMLGACRGGDGNEETTAPSGADRATELAERLVIVDTHIDLPYRLAENWEDVSVETEDGDFDFPRARRGGLDVAFMSIYVPASYQETGGATMLADDLIDSVERLAREHPDEFALVSDVDGVEAGVGNGRVLLAMGMENGAPLEGQLDNLQHFYDRGVRYITLAHSKSNRISDSSYDEERRWNGLSPFGREVVAEMNRLGMMVDVSHLTDEATAQAIELSRAPVIASHSSCRHFTPDWERNLSDELIVALAEKGGVVQINFGSGFIDEEYHRKWTARYDQIEQYFEEHSLDPESEEGKEFSDRYRSENPIDRSTVERVADHIDHVVALVGIDHVGLGSDFDGLGDSLPEGLRDVSEYPNLIRVLLERGYDEESISKICSGNLLRVWREVESLSESS
jgi:membrane dipeptidase